MSSLLKAFIHGLLFPVLSFTQVKLKLQSSLESFTKIPLCVRGLEKESDCFLGKKMLYMQVESGLVSFGKHVL